VSSISNDVDRAPSKGKVTTAFSGPGTVPHVGLYNQEEIIGMVSENVTCPKCSHKNPAGYHECVKCGLIFAKYYEFLERKNKAEMEPDAQQEQLEIDVAAAEESEVISDDSEPKVVKDLTDWTGADAVFAETATEVQAAMDEVEIVIDEKPLNPSLLDRAAARNDLEDERHPKEDGIVVTETLSDVDSSELSDVMTAQSLAQASAEEEVDLSEAGDQKERSAARVAADVDSEAQRHVSDQPETVGRTACKEDFAEAVFPLEASQPDSTPAETCQPQPSRAETEAPAEPVSVQTEVVGQAGAEPDSDSDDEEVLVLVDLIPETAADSAAVEADGGEDQIENLSAEPESEPAEKVLPAWPAPLPHATEEPPGPEYESPQDWRRKVKQAMATKRDLKDIILAYEGQSIAINYYDSTQIQEAELIFVNNLFFSAFVKSQNLLYSFPLHTIISVAEKIESRPDGKPASHSKFPAVITVSPPSYL